MSRMMTTRSLRPRRSARTNEPQISTSFRHDHIAVRDRDRAGARRGGRRRGHTPEGGTTARLRAGRRSPTRPPQAIDRRTTRQSRVPALVGAGPGAAGDGRPPSRRRGSPQPRDRRRRRACGLVLCLRTRASRHRLYGGGPRQNSSAPPPGPEGIEPARGRGPGQQLLLWRGRGRERTATANSTRGPTNAATVATCSKCWRCTGRPSRS